VITIVGTVPRHDWRGSTARCGEACLAKAGYTSGLMIAGTFILAVIFVLVFIGEVGGGSFGPLVAVAEAEDLLDFFI